MLSCYFSFLHKPRKRISPMFFCVWFQSVMWTKLLQWVQVVSTCRSSMALLCCFSRHSWATCMSTGRGWLGFCDWRLDASFRHWSACKQHTAMTQQTVMGDGEWSCNAACCRTAPGWCTWPAGPCSGQWPGAASSPACTRHLRRWSASLSSWSQTRFGPVGASWNKTVAVNC